MFGPNTDGLVKSLNSGFLRGHHQYKGLKGRDGQKNGIHDLRHDSRLYCLYYAYAKHATHYTTVVASALSPAAAGLQALNQIIIATLPGR